MTHRNVNQKLGFRLSEGSGQKEQLLEEGIWIIECLDEIRTLRNHLKIQRMHLESLKDTENKNIVKNEFVVNDPEESIVSTSAVDLMQNVTVGKPFDGLIRINEQFCNEEEHNLMVSNPGFIKNMVHDDYNMEEDEVESDDDIHETC